MAGTVVMFTSSCGRLADLQQLQEALCCYHWIDLLAFIELVDAGVIVNLLGFLFNCNRY